MCGFAMLLTYERHPCLTGAEKRISSRFKKENLDMLDNNNTSIPPTTHAPLVPCDVIKTIT